MSTYWFKPKRYGYGATPTTWQGWLVSVLFIILAMGARPVLGAMLDSETVGPAYLGFIVILLAGFVVLVRAKTSGPWRWNWG